MRRIAFICPYFGKFPKHLQLWLNSCEENKNHTWFIFTDDKTEFRYPDNVIVRYMSIDEMRKEFQEKFDFQISLDKAYKLGDYKPLYGYLFEDLIREYDAWGHIDVSDEIYGSIDKFITDELIEKYDKLMIFGHMTIYKNTPEVNRRFMEKSDIDLSYKDIFASDKFYNFEEITSGSIYKIYRENGYQIGRLDDVIADLSGLSYPFSISRWNDECTRNSLSKEPMIFSWENGRVYGYSLVNKKIVKNEFLYVHFKRRKMNLNISVDSKNYCIVPDGFVPFNDPITEAFIKNNSKKKLFYDVYFQEKKKGLNRRLNKFLRK